MEKLVDPRIVDPEMIEWVRTRRDGFCLYGLVHKDGCSEGLDVHHIQTKGSGGDDVPENLITLCRKHHNEFHNGKIPAEALRKVLRRFFDYPTSD